MAKHKEIEVKWRASNVKRKTFNASLVGFLKAHKHRFHLVTAGGPDVYYASKDGNVLRHRKSGDLNELTVKTRVNAKSIKVRREINLPLAAKASSKDLAALLKLVGFRHKVTISKTCDIYYVSDNGVELTIVWYVTTSGNGKYRTFIEVEIDGISVYRSVKLLTKWCGIIEFMFGLSDHDVSDLSLYEIYTRKRYHIK